MSKPAVHAANAGRPDRVNLVKTTQANTALITDATIAAIGRLPLSSTNLNIALFDLMMPGRRSGGDATSM
jgi:hypothetical protein